MQYSPSYIPPGNQYSPPVTSNPPMLWLEEEEEEEIEKIEELKKKQKQREQELAEKRKQQELKERARTD
jgi:hypothetical protein